MRTAKYLVLSSLVIFAFNACGDDDSNGAFVIPPDASLDAALIPDGSLGGSGGSGGSGGTAGNGGNPDVPDASVDAAPDATVAPDSGDAGPSCTDGVHNGDELGIDCGTSCGATCSDVFESDADTLAIFELNGDVLDSSGNGRDATLLAPFADAGIDAGDPANRFVDTEWGQGLSFVDTDSVDRPWGFDWSQYASELDDTFTIEMVLVPTASDCYQRLFAFEDQNDDGWYLCDGVTSYFGTSYSVALPLADGGPAEVIVDERHYLAFVVHAALNVDANVQSEVDIYLDGALLGTVTAAFLSPPTEAIFFEDFGGGEQFDGVVDSVRISNGNRSAAEIAAVWDKLSEQPL